MKIANTTFLSFVPQNSLRKPYLATGFVTKYYCGPMNVKGLCTENCEACKASIQKAFSNLNTANNPEALLTWCLRREVAVQQELGNQHVAPARKESIFLPTPENPFLELARSLGGKP
jgi:hypothetical protein